MNEHESCINIYDYEEILVKYNKLLSFVKKISNGFTLTQTTHEALDMFVKQEHEAFNLLSEIGEL